MLQSYFMCIYKDKQMQIYWHIFTYTINLQELLRRGAKLNARLSCSFRVKEVIFFFGSKNEDYVTRPSLVTINTQIAGHLLFQYHCLTHIKIKTPPHSTSLLHKDQKFLSIDQNYLHFGPYNSLLETFLYIVNVQQISYNGFYPLDAGNIPQLRQPKSSADIAKCPLFREVGEGQNSPPLKIPALE